MPRHNTLKQILATCLLVALIVPEAAAAAINTSPNVTNPPGPNTGSITDKAKAVGEKLGKVNDLTDKIGSFGNFLPSVPVRGSGGFFDQVSQVNINASSISEGLVRSFAAGAVNDSSRAAMEEFTKEFQEKTNIESFSKYGNALTDYYVTDELGILGGEDALINPDDPGPDRQLDDVVSLSGWYGNLGLNAIYTPQQASRAGAVDARSRRTASQQQNWERSVRRLVMGATAQFTRGISCGGLNGRALENTARYLASATRGFADSEIDARNRDFYEKMGRWGQPASTPPYWKLQFEAMSQDVEARAAAAAAREQIAPGQKASRDVDSRGNARIVRSSDIIRTAQNRTFGGGFDAAIAGGQNYLYPVRKFNEFLGLVLALYGSHWAGKLIGKLTGGLVDKLGGPASWVVAAKSYGTFVGEEIAFAFAKSLYDRMIDTIFRGKILGESSRCRRPRSEQLTDFKTGVKTEDLANGQGTEEEVVFEVSPNRVIQGVTEPKVTLTWDAHALPLDTTVEIDEFGKGFLEKDGTTRLQAHDSLEDDIDLSQEYQRELDECKNRNELQVQCQEYRLILNRDKPNQTVFQRVVELPFPNQLPTDLNSRISLIVSPVAVQDGETVTLEWSVPEDAEADVILPQLSATPRAKSGTAAYTVSNASSLPETQVFDLLVTEPGKIGNLLGEKHVPVIVNPAPPGGSRSSSASVYLSAPFTLKPRE